jgi:hypothetical protein
MGFIETYFLLIIFTAAQIPGILASLGQKKEKNMTAFMKLIPFEKKFLQLFYVSCSANCPWEMFYFAFSFQ